MLTLHKEQTTITKSQGKALKQRWTPPKKAQCLPHCTGDPGTKNNTQETWPDTVENTKQKNKRYTSYLAFSGNWLPVDWPIVFHIQVTGASRGMPNAE